MIRSKKKECFEIEKHNYPRNLERSREKKGKLEWESEGRRGKERSFGKILRDWLSKYVLKQGQVFETLWYRFEQVFNDSMQN
jgi:hypothetical protein